MTDKEYEIGDMNKNKRPHRGHGPGRMAAGEKADNFGQAMKDLIQYCRKYAVMIIGAVILAAAGTILNVIGPSKLADITDYITAGLRSTIDVDAVVKICITLAVMYGLGFLFSMLQGLIMADVTQKVSKGLRSEISEKINRLPLSFFDHSSTGDILSRVTNDVDTLSQTLNQSLGTMVSAITMFFGSLIMMFLTNWIMALVGIGATILGFGLMMFIVKRSQKYFMRQQNQLGAIDGYIEEIYAGHTIVKAFNGEEKSKKEFQQMNHALYDSAWKSQFMSGMMQPLMGFVGNLGYVAVCVTGAVLTMNGMAEFSVIIAFMLYIRLFTQPLSQIAQAATSLQSAAAASERVFHFLREEEMPSEEDAEVLPSTDFKGNVEFDHVKFGYAPKRTIIHDFSAVAKQGQKIAIVGPTGAGKTTMVNLLMRFYDTWSGEIRIDGHPINQMTRASVHDHFCMVLQDTWLFEGTIKENIIYSKKNVSDETVIKACKAVGLHHFITTLPHGYDTVLNDQANLSVGQKQLITIARAMVEDAPMLILDEATSSVDTRTEELIQKAMDQLMAGRTSFVIAHRLSTIRNADLILVMKDGDIIEKGTHQQLLDQKGFYADLYNSQFELV
jgi:ATP-binding cassette subfamily B protein